MLTVLQETEISDADFKRVAQVVYKHCGIHLTDAKRQLVSARLAKRVRVMGYKTYREYLDSVLSNPNGDEFTTLIDSLSTNLTSFFRENDHFVFLKTRFVSQIVQERGSSKRYIRGWSAGCSTGEEPYTIAITLMESLPQPGSWDIKLMASDISTKVLAQASSGVYTADKLQMISPQLKAKYFEPRKLPDGTPAYAVHPTLRHLITFKYANLMEPFPFQGPMDFIFCRNVMIYFDKPTQEKLVNRYYQMLRPGGYLFTGHSESLTGVKHPFKYVQATIYQR